MAARIEDYAMIGDCNTAALVGRDGSIDWYCCPRFDSGACFAALLGDENNGRWLIGPRGSHVRRRRHYRGNTMVLETIFEGPTGAARLIDFMPMGTENQSIVRIVEGIRGKLAMHTELIIRFDYGVTVPWVSKVDRLTHSAIAGPYLLTLRTPVQIRGKNMHSVGSFTVHKGEKINFTLTYSRSYRPMPPPLDVEAALEATERFWRDWSAICKVRGKWAPITRRSLATLKAMTYRKTGGIVAAVTTSLPEQLGGPRNWDYRYCWLRDATFTLLAFLNAGYREEALAWQNWLMYAIAGSPEQMQTMYGVAGERRLDELELPWLSGYEGSRPVRIGNAAAKQLQLDVYGELADVTAQGHRGGLPDVPRRAHVHDTFLSHLERIWRMPDEGIWEIRAEPQHFVYSKVMAWVAFDRASRSDADKAKRRKWKAIAREIHAEVCRKGVDRKRGCFVQAYGSKQLDASLLLLPIVNFLPVTDPRMRRTIEEIEKHLTYNGLVMRYHSDTGVDGLPPGEGAFLACSFWLADNYILLGRTRDAERLFENLVGHCNDVGLLAEEYDPVTKRMLGNFPQAFSHVALVNTALSLIQANRRSRTRTLLRRARRRRRPARRRIKR